MNIKKRLPTGSWCYTKKKQFVQVIQSKGDYRLVKLGPIKTLWIHYLALLPEDEATN